MSRSTSVPHEAQNFQFSMRTLFVITTAVALFCGVLRAAPALLVPLALGTWFFLVAWLVSQRSFLADAASLLTLTVLLLALLTSLMQAYPVGGMEVDNGCGMYIAWRKQQSISAKNRLPWLAGTFVICSAGWYAMRIAIRSRGTA